MYWPIKEPVAILLVNLYIKLNTYKFPYFFNVVILLTCAREVSSSANAVYVILIGVMLVVEGWAHEAAEDLHLKNYIYFAMAFAAIVDILQLRLKQTQNPVKLHKQPKLPEKSS